MFVLALLCLITLFVAYANGANDNFKGVATLYGANVAGYKKAITIATIATFAGCVASVFLAEGLVKAFSGKGLVPDAVAVSPVASVLLTVPLYKLATNLRVRSGITKESCVCIAPGQFVPATAYVATGGGSGACCQPGAVFPSITVTTGTAPGCMEKYNGLVLGLTPQKLIDGVHYLSAAAVSFARGLNDTPKIVGLLFAVKAFNLQLSMLAIATAMAIGGWLNARKVAETMAKKISKMNDGQATTANLVTAFLVILASRLGLPLSTTHVSVGAISGVGIVNGSADKSVIGSILMSWVLTLPIAAIISALAFAFYSKVF